MQVSDDLSPCRIKTSKIIEVYLLLPELDYSRLFSMLFRMLCGSPLWDTVSKGRLVSWPAAAAGKPSTCGSAMLRSWGTVQPVTLNISCWDPWRGRCWVPACSGWAVSGLWWSLPDGRCAVVLRLALLGLLLWKVFEHAFTQAFSDASSRLVSSCP